MQYITTIYNLSLHDALPISLLHRRVRRQVCQRRVQLGLGGAGDAVRRPGVREVRGVGEVVTGVDVPVLRGHHERVVVPVAGGVGRDPFRDGVPTVYAEGATFAERGLDIDHQQCTSSHTATIPRPAPD